MTMAGGLRRGRTGDMACGHPSDDWNQLLAEVRTEIDRLERIAAGAVQPMIDKGLYMTRSLISLTTNRID